MLKDLSEGQIEWILEEIRRTKETTYTGDDYYLVKMSWDPALFDMDKEELEDLKKLHDALTEKNDLGTITG